MITLVQFRPDILVPGKMTALGMLQILQSAFFTHMIMRKNALAMRKYLHFAREMLDLLHPLSTSH